MNMSSVAKALSILLVVAGVAGAQVEPGSEGRDALVQANNRGAVRLLKVAILKAGPKEEQERDVIIPAFSSSSVLWLLSNGASDEARAELESVLGKTGLQPGHINDGVGKIQDVISKARPGPVGFAQPKGGIDSYLSVLIAQRSV